MNENVFQSGFDPAPFIFERAKRRDGLLQGGRVVAADVQRGAERRRLPNARLAAQLLRQPGQVRPLTDQVVSRAWATTSAAVPWASNFPSRM